MNNKKCAKYKANNDHTNVEFKKKEAKAKYDAKRYNQKSEMKKKEAEVDMAKEAVIQAKARLALAKKNMK